MKKLNFIMILFVMLFLTSCKVPTSVKFENYVDNVEANCEYWTEKESINKSIGRFNGILVKKGIESVDKSINDFIDKLPSLFEGFMSAFEE